MVAGVQDGIWPNVRLRGGLLQTWRLPDAIQAARTGPSSSLREPWIVDVRRCTTSSGCSSAPCRVRATVS